jgi:hypothetical protein
MDESLGLTAAEAMALIGIKTRHTFQAWIARKRAQGIECRMEGLNLYRRDRLIEAAYGKDRAPAAKLDAYEKQKRKEYGRKTPLCDGPKKKGRN